MDVFESFPSFFVLLLFTSVLLLFSIVQDDGILDLGVNVQYSGRFFIDALGMKGLVALDRCDDVHDGVKENAELQIRPPESKRYTAGLVYFIVVLLFQKTLISNFGEIFSCNVYSMMIRELTELVD